MKISTKGRYALRLMLDLAVYDTGDPIRIRDIAARQQISEKYLEQIIAILNKAGYVKSVRGPQGGYHLMKDPAQYTAGMILRLTEGSLAPVACLEDEVNACERQEGCVTLRLWQMLNQAVSDVVDRVTRGAKRELYHLTQKKKECEFNSLQRKTSGCAYKNQKPQTGRAEVSDFFCIFCNSKNIPVNLQNSEKEGRFSCTRSF